MTKRTEDFDALFEEVLLNQSEKSVKISAPESVSAAVEGELTFHRVAPIKTALQQALAAAKDACAPLRIDMSALTECDGAGLQLLLSLTRSAFSAGVPIEWQGMPASLAELFKRYGLAGQISDYKRSAAS